MCKLEKKNYAKTIQETHDKNEIASKTKTKCINKKCSFQGLNLNNKNAVGSCSQCGNFEQFTCLGVSQEYKDDIRSGKMKFVCSLCFSKNPSIANTKDMFIKPATPQPKSPLLLLKVMFIKPPTTQPKSPRILLMLYPQLFLRMMWRKLETLVSYCLH